MSFLEKSRKMNLLFSIISVVLGIVFIAFSSQIVNLICYIIGGAILVYGIISVISYFMSKNEEYSYNGVLIKGIALIIIGLILLFNKYYIYAILPIIFGIILIAVGISYIQKAIFLKSNNISNWVIEMVGAIVTLALGVFMLMSPFRADKIAIILIGICLVWYGVTSLFTYIFVQKKINNIKEAQEKNDIIDIN